MIYVNNPLLHVFIGKSIGIIEDLCGAHEIPYIYFYRNQSISVTSSKGESMSCLQYVFHKSKKEIAKYR
jgi:hypothetical protein